jgi:hypothetical protein
MFKTKANVLFKENKIGQTLASYFEALTFFLEVSKKTDIFPLEMELRAQVYNNICACYLQKNEFENVIRFSKIVLGHSGFERNEKEFGRYALAVAK